jgi:hypothetical protein
LSHSASPMRSFLMLFLDSRIKQGPASSVSFLVPIFLHSLIHLVTHSIHILHRCESDRDKI